MNQESNLPITPVSNKEQQQVQQQLQRQLLLKMILRNEALRKSKPR